MSFLDVVSSRFIVSLVVVLVRMFGVNFIGMFCFWYFVILMWLYLIDIVLIYFSWGFNYMNKKY